MDNHLKKILLENSMLLEPHRYNEFDILRNELCRLKNRVKILEKENEILISENMLPGYKYVYRFNSGLVITKGGGKLASVIKDIKEYLDE